MAQIQDRTAVIITALLAIIGIGVTATKRQELEAYLRDELADIERQIAADRPTAD
jgi:hypothetical protein